MPRRKSSAHIPASKTSSTFQQ